MARTGVYLHTVALCSPPPCGRWGTTIICYRWHAAKAAHRGVPRVRLASSVCCHLLLALRRVQHCSCGYTENLLQYPAACRWLCCVCSAGCCAADGALQDGARANAPRTALARTPFRCSNDIYCYSQHDVWQTLPVHAVFCGRV